MKLSKGQGMSLFAAFILFGIFNVVVFLAPLAHTVVFWLGYFFALFALATIALTLVLHFGKPVPEEKFLSLPSVKVAWTYFVLQTALSVWEMVAFPLPYLPALIINLVLGAVFAITILVLYAAAGKIDKSEQFTAEKVVFIKQLKIQVDSIETENAELAKALKELSENIRFSDPMSHSKLKDIEDSLVAAVDELENNASDVDKALSLCTQVEKLLKRRNDQCKMYKGVKDQVAAEAQKSGNGRGVAFAGVCVMLAMFLITISVYFVIVPQTKYNDAIAMMKAEKYDEATAAFTNLGDYRDSEVKIEEIKIILLDKKYDAAVGLLNAEKYDEATAAFTELGDHRDSKAKIEEIRIILLDNQYDEAEKLFNEGKYDEAINVYTTLGDYRDSKLRVEQIYNRLSEGDTLYFGTYNGKPITWKILKTEKNKMLLITKEPIAEKPFHDEIKKVTWETSYLRTWLNEEFFNSFSDAQKDQILATNTGSVEDKIFLFSLDEMNDLVRQEKITFKTTDEWWTRSSSEDGIMYATVKGWVKAAGDQVVRDKGVRPAIWISLE